MPPTTITKRDTETLKGVAILMMLWLHLFHGLPWVSLSTPIFIIEGIPLVTILTNATNPVYFFTFLSGYGLYLSYLNKGRKNVLRVKKLYTQYWICTIPFVIVGALLKKNNYPGDILTILYNLTGWYTTYNGTIWFLLPYSLLAMSSSMLFKFYDKLNIFILCTIITCLYLCCLTILHFWGKYLFTHQLAYMPEHYCELLCPFTIGYISAKYGRLDLLEKKLGHGWKPLGLLLIIFLIMIFINSTLSAILYPLYVMAFCFLFVLLKKPVWLQNIFIHLGKVSTSMWFVHAYFCWYFFSNIVYSLKYPLLIFLFLVIISYVTALLIRLIYR